MYFPSFVDQYYNSSGKKNINRHLHYANYPPPTPT